MKSFYKESKDFVRVAREEGEYFPVKDGERQGRVMSSSLFNIFMDGVVR